MSLINDALKRAKAAQQQAPLPQVDLPFRPVEPAQQRARRGLGLMLPAGLALVACLTLLLLWQWAQTREAAAPIEVTARTAPAPTAPPIASPAPAAVDAGVVVSAAPPQPEQAPPPAAPNTAAAAPAVASPAVADAAAKPADAMVADIQKDETAPAAPVAAPAAAKPVPLRLQAIVFDPKRPSAMISGKLVFAGDKIRDLRVVRIDQESATLAGAGLTNVLTLCE